MIRAATRSPLPLLATAALVLAACTGEELSVRRTVTDTVVIDTETTIDTGTRGAGEATPSDGDAAATLDGDPGVGRDAAGPSTPPILSPAIEAETGVTPRDSDRGVTDDTITIGVISTLSGGQRFVGEPPYRTAVAYAEVINRQGGINGRTVEVRGYDVCIACPEDGLAQAKRAVEQDNVFAILNGFIANAALGPAGRYLAETGTPMIQTAGGPTLNDHQFQLGLDMPHRGAINADFVRNYLDQQGLPPKVALLRFAQPLDESISAAQRRALETVGIQIVDEAVVEYGAGMTAQSSQVAKMRNSGASMVVGSHGVVCAFNMQAAAQAGWNAPYLCTIMYGDFAVEIADRAVTGRDVFTDSDGFAPLERSGPGVAAYSSMMSTFYPSGEVGLITMSSFLGMRVFEEGVASMGDNVTREGLLAHLNSLENYDAGGLTPPFTVTPTDRIAIRGAYILRLDDDRRWQPVSPDWVYPDPVHGLPR